MTERDSATRVVSPAILIFILTFIRPLWRHGQTFSPATAGPLMLIHGALPASKDEIPIKIKMRTRTYPQIALIGFGGQVVVPGGGSMPFRAC